MTLLLSYFAGVLPVVQFVLSILIVGAVLLQSRGAGVGAFIDTANVTFYKRRGGELLLFRATIVFGVLFALTSFAALFIH